MLAEPFTLKMEKSLKAFVSFREQNCVLNMDPNLRSIIKYSIFSTKCFYVMTVNSFFSKLINFILSFIKEQSKRTI